MNPRTECDSRRQGEPCVVRLPRCGGHTLIELLIVTLIIALLATIAIPEYNEVQQRAYNAAALADLNNANKEIERFFSEHYRYPADENELMAEGYSNTPGVAFTTFSIRDAGNPQTTRVHMHIDHAGSRQYYHYEYPVDSGLPELRWKSSSSDVESRLQRSGPSQP